MADVMVPIDSWHGLNRLSVRLVYGRAVYIMGSRQYSPRVAARVTKLWMSIVGYDPNNELNEVMYT